MRNKLTDDWEESDQAQKLTKERIQPYNEKVFFNNYLILFDNFIVPLRNNELHNNIMAQINYLISKRFFNKT
jgi:hypothetical protein